MDHRDTTGLSRLFVDPLNRPNGVFEVIAGVVDTDTYRAPIHFPFFPVGEDGLHVIEKGSPMVQVITFRRNGAAIEADIRAETDAERNARTRVTRNTQSASGWYRAEARTRKWNRSAQEQTPVGTPAFLVGLTG